MCHLQSKVSQPGYKAGFNSECLFVVLLCVSLALYSLSWNFIFQSRSLKFKWNCVFVWIEYKMQRILLPILTRWTTAPSVAGHSNPCSQLLDTVTVSHPCRDQTNIKWFAGKLIINRAAHSNEEWNEDYKINANLQLWSEVFFEISTRLEYDDLYPNQILISTVHNFYNLQDWSWQLFCNFPRK